MMTVLSFFRWTIPLNKFSLCCCIAKGARISLHLASITCPFILSKAHKILFTIQQTFPGGFSLETLWKRCDVVNRLWALWQIWHITDNKIRKTISARDLVPQAQRFIRHHAGLVREKLRLPSPQDTGLALVLCAGASARSLSVAKPWLSPCEPLTGDGSPKCHLSWLRVQVRCNLATEALLLPETGISYKT